MDPVIFQMRRYSETLDKTSFTWLARLLIQYALHPLQIIHSRFEMKKKNNKTKQNKIKQNKTKQEQQQPQENQRETKAQKERKEISYHIWWLHIRAFKNYLDLLALELILSVKTCVKG